MSAPSEKTVVLLATTLDVATALNVVGHLCLALGRAADASLVHSSHYVDLSGCRHLGVSAWPLVILKTRPRKLRDALEEARQRPELLVGDYPREVLTTSTDAELTEAIGALNEPDLEYLGIAAHGIAASIDDVFRRFSLVRHEPPVPL